MSRLIPAPLERWWTKRWRRIAVRPTLGSVDFGDLRTLQPISSEFGYDRGLPVDRYYIEQFLARHAVDIAGRVLEIGDDHYTRRFGGVRVSRSDVLHLVAGNPRATLVADLTDATELPSDCFDSIIFTQTLQFIYDHEAALRTLHRVLKPGGVLLATLPGITKIPQDEWGPRCAWSYTALSARRLVEDAFSADQLVVETRGNVMAACAFLHGLAANELDAQELDHLDPLFPVLISVRARKAG